MFYNIVFVTADAARVKRQEDTTAKKEESFEAELCKDKDAGEWFRLVAGEGDACRDVIQCTSSVSTIKYFEKYILPREINFKLYLTFFLITIWGGSGNQSRRKGESVVIINLMKNITTVHTTEEQNRNISF